LSAPAGSIDFRRGSSLDILPGLPNESVHVVLTSPPYCNRYDYTRTYALELAFLGYGDEHVKRLRQSMLSCTVENRGKSTELMDIYARHKAPQRFMEIERVYQRQQALNEVLDCLETQRRAGQLNNPNITRMVRNYFHEMCFVIAELARVLLPGGKVFMVNDNVRYGGEEVPVDLILSDIAGDFGLEVDQIWTLPRGKGNSSQQMGSHGRSELRKCVYVWAKPS
jgi:DNA modification methylase